jgi:hypothetical protein
MLLIESDYDEELEIIAKLAMEEERSTYIVLLNDVAHLSCVIACKPGKIFFATILLNGHYILINIFEGGFG